MLAKWLEILPVFIYKVIVRSIGERIKISDKVWIIASEDVIVKEIENER